MSRESAALLMLLVLGGIGAILCIVSIVLSVKENKIKQCSTVTAEGKINRYTFVGKAPAPVVEYQVDGKSYEAVRSYRGLVITRTHIPKGMGYLDTDYNIYVNDKDIMHIERGNNYLIDLDTVGEKLWPVGSRMNVYYDPGHPEKAFADVMPSQKSPLVWVFLWTGVLMIGMGILCAALF